MTKINKLVLHGFKSFAKYTELVFGDNFNCVIGGNGSGKSNVLDSLTFVLGKAGSKSMRAEKSANLLYNGGKSKSPAKKGEVSIFFDNKDKTFPTEEQDVKVTRIVNSSGQSIYKINDDVRTRQQIVDLLNIAKIDADAYNIILQGDIIRFCDMSPIERRMLIEEISGISIYEEKKQKAIGQITKVEERIREADIILAERKTYLKELKKDRDQALKFRELSDNVRKYKASLLNLQIVRNGTEHKELQEKIEKNNSFLKDNEKNVSDARKEVDKKKATIEEITVEIEKTGERDQVNLNREIEGIKIENTRKSSRVEQLISELKKLSQRKQDIEGNLKEVGEKIAGLTAQKSKSIDSISSRKKELDSVSSKLESFRRENNVESAIGIEKRLDEIDSRSEEISKEIHILREKQHNILREKDRISHESAMVEESMRKLSEIEKEHRKQIDEIRLKREEFKKAILSLNKLLDRDSYVTAKLNAMRTSLNSKREELARLEVRNASVRELSMDNKAVKAILDRKSVVPGIYGTVSELGSVSQKYSTAMEVSAGNRIRSIVVDNDHIAAEQIKYLRANRLGIATFLPLNKIKSRHISDSAKDLLKAKGVYGLASDLISYEQKFRNVFLFLFGDTIVVDDIDVARRIGIGNAKMVTLDGDIAEISGSMKGGFRDKKKKGLGFNEAQLSGDIEKATSEIAELENAMAAFENERASLEQEITSFRSRKAELEGEIIKSEKSLHLDSSDMSASAQKIDELKKEDKRVESEINELQKSISDKNKSLMEMKIERQKLRSKISSLRDPAVIAEMSAYEEKGRKLKEDILGLEAESKNIDIQIRDIFGPEIEKSKAILRHIDKDKQSFEAESKAANVELEKNSAILKKKEEEAKEFYLRFKELFHNRSKLHEEILKLEALISGIIEKSRETEIRNNTLSIKNAEISGHLAGLREEFSQYESVQLDTEMSEEQLKYSLQKFEKMKDEIGSVNMRALEIYEEIEKEFNTLVEKKDVLSKEKDDVSSMIGEIESRKKELFMKCYTSVNEEFKKIFLKLSTKGEASLELENSDNPFEEGVMIKVRLSGQKFLDIRSLSGGEKTMTALAFIFAIQEHEPASFYVLDEVDAALDKHNSEKLSKLIRSYSQKAQYILISHNDAMISEADNLYGVTMDESGISKVVSLRV